MTKLLRVGGDTYDVGAPGALQGFFATVSQNLEPGGRGSRFPLIMNNLYDGRLDPADAPAALRELEEMERGLVALPIDRVVWGASTMQSKGRGSWVNGAARNVREYFVGENGRPLITALFEAVGRSRERSEPVQLDTPFNRRMPAGLMWLLGTYCVAAFVYLMYGIISQTGLGGYLMAIEMRVTGYASRNVSVLLGISVLLIPILLVGASLEKLAPNLLRKRTKAEAPSQPGHFALSWRGIMAITAILLLAGAGITALFAYRGYEELRGSVYAMDLSDRGATLPADATFVELTGVLAGAYATGFTERERVDLYAPITGADWTPAEPIQYILHYTTRELERDGKPRLPPAFRIAGPARFPGKLTTSLPVVVHQNYQSKGLKIAPSYQVVDWTDLPAGKVPTRGRYDDALVSGLVSVLVVGLTFLVLVQVRRTFPVIGEGGNKPRRV